MPEPTQKSHPEIEPDIRPPISVIQGPRGPLRPESYDSGAGSSSTARDLSSREQSAGEGGQDTVSSEDSRQSAKEQEEQGNWQIDRKNNADQGAKSKNSPSGAKNRFIPIIFVVSLITGGGIVSTTPHLIADVVMKEIVTQEFNDSATMLELRKNRILPVVLEKDSTNGICTTKLSVACRYKRAGAPLIERITEAGGKVTCDGNCDKKFNNKIKSIEFPPSTKNPGGLVVDDPAKFRGAMLGDIDAASLMNRAYNPMFFSIWDGTAGRALSKMGITKSKKFTSDNVEENKDIARKAGNIPSVDGKPLIPKHDDPNDPNKITGYTDSSGKVYTPEEGSKISEAAESIAGSTGDAASKVARGVVGTVGVIGAASTACQAIKTLEVVSMGAKTIRTASSILAAETILSEADAKKANIQTPAGAQATGELLTERNADESAIDSNGNKIPNPDLGKTAFDAIGVRVIQGFVSNPQLSSADARFMVGTPTTGVLDNLARLARNVVNPSVCGAINNPWVQAGSVVAGIAAAIFTGGFSTTQMVAQGAFSAVVSVGMSYAEAMIKDMAAGNMEDNFRNVGVGNTTVVGTSEMHQRIAGSRGAGYLTDQNISDFNGIRAQVSEDRVALETHDARKDPLNPMLQYSFAGILARQLLPVQLAATPSSKFLSIAALPFKSLMSILSPTSLALNAKPYDPSRYEVCKDEKYKSLGIKADIFCNLRRGMTKEELSRDPVQVGEWMVANNYVDDTVNTEGVDVTTLAKGDYKKFLDNCVAKVDVPPGTSEEEGNDNWANQTNCVTPKDIDQNTLSNFRVFTIDYSVIDGMNNEVKSIGAASGGGAGAPAGGGNGELVTGDAKDLARQLLNNPNIVFVSAAATQASLQKFADTGQATNSCGQPFTIDPMLSGVLLGLSTKYRVFINNFGFSNDRGSCDSGQHPQGRAVDINGIEQIGGGKTNWGNLSFNSSELPVITNYANDWLNMLPPDRGGVGQKGCSGFAITPPADAVNVNGSMFFADSCDHLHIDVRQR